MLRHLIGHNRHRMHITRAYIDIDSYESKFLDEECSSLGVYNLYLPASERGHSAKAQILGSCHLSGGAKGRSQC